MGVPKGCLRNEALCMGIIYKWEVHFSAIEFHHLLSGPSDHGLVFIM